MQKKLILPLVLCNILTKRLLQVHLRIQEASRQAPVLQQLQHLEQVSRCRVQASQNDALLLFTSQISKFVKKKELLTLKGALLRLLWYVNKRQGQEVAAQFNTFRKFSKLFVLSNALAKLFQAFANRRKQCLFNKLRELQ